MGDTDAPFRAAAETLLRELREVADAWDQELRHPDQAQYDVGIRLVDGRSGAVEVTRLMDEAVARHDGSFQRLDGVLPYDGTGRWYVQLAAPNVDLKRFKRRVPELLQELATAGVHSVNMLGWTVAPDPTALGTFRESRVVLEELEHFGVLGLEFTPCAQPEIRISDLVSTKLASAGDLAEQLMRAVAVKAPKVISRAETAWLLVWIDWTETHLSVLLWNAKDTDWPGLDLPDGLDGVIVASRLVEAGADALPVAIFARECGWKLRSVDGQSIVAALRGAV